MKIKISEVWNSDGESIELAKIETTGNPTVAVLGWISNHRPDLTMASTIYAHGFHAVEVG